MAISLYGKRVSIIEDGDGEELQSNCNKCCLLSVCGKPDNLICEDEYGEYHRHFQEVATTIES